MRLRVLAVVPLLLLTGATNAADTGIRSADPSVIIIDDGYVAVEARNGRTLLVRVAETLEGLSEAKPVRIWFDRERLGEVWAPEIVFRNGQYEVYFAAGVGSDHRMYALTSPKPAEGYGEATEVVLPNDKWAIDGLPFTFAGQHYFVWSGWAGDTDVRQDIYLVRLGEDGMAQGPRAMIGTPDQRWENVAGEQPSINEGPQPIIDPSGQLHIVYSANGSWGPNYCIADLRLVAGGDPLEPTDWFKSPGCLFGAASETLAEGIVPATLAKGIGHHSFALPNGDAEQGGGAGETTDFLYHGVPSGEDPDNFWAARKWFSGSYTWVSDTTYRSHLTTDTGWSIRFSE
jgi:GH43 family beta-xylosidase